jgi:hypothetical protein
VRRERNLKHSQEETANVAADSCDGKARVCGRSPKIAREFTLPAAFSWNEFRG